MQEMREGNSGIDLFKAITVFFCSAAVMFKFARSVFIFFIKKKPNKKTNKPYGWVDTVWSLQQRSPLARLRHTEHSHWKVFSWYRSNFDHPLSFVPFQNSKTLRFYFVLLPRFFIAGHLKFSLMPQEEFWESAVNFVRKLKLGLRNLGHSCLLSGAFTVVMSVRRRRAAELFESTKQASSVLFHTLTLLYFDF